MRLKSDARLRPWMVVWESADRYRRSCDWKQTTMRTVIGVSGGKAIMGRWHVFRLFVVIMAVALPLVGRGAAAKEEMFLKVAQDPAVGSFLTDAEGNTLYLFTPDATPGE